MQAPQLMLCKPTTNDRWDRRAVELAAYAFHHGTCNVSEVSVTAVAQESCVSSSLRPQNSKAGKQVCPVQNRGAYYLQKTVQRRFTTLSIASLMFCPAVLTYLS